MFLHLERNPHPALLPFVKAFWYVRVKSTVSIPSINAVPNPEQCLYFYPKSKPKLYVPDGGFVVGTNATIFGQGTTHGRVVLPQDYLMFKIMFQAGGFYRLFGTPMTLFSEGPEDGEAVFGKEIVEVREQIEQTEDFNKLVEISENYLLKKIKQVKIDALPIDYVMQQMNWTHQSLDQLARQACLSTRQFERKFLERLGVSPKFYGRVVRFNYTMKGRKKKSNESLMNLAYSYGYFDHNHLLRDFKQFTGSLPTQFNLETALIY